MERSGLYGIVVGAAALVLAVVALVLAISAPGGDSDGAGDVSGVMAGVSAQGAQIDALSAQVASLQSDVSGVNASVAALQEQVDAMGDEDDDGASADEGQVDELEAELEELSGAFMELQRDIDADTDHEDVDAEDIHELHDELGELSDGLEAIQGRLESAADESSEGLSDLSSELGELSSAVMALQHASAHEDDEDDEELANLIDWLMDAVAPAYTQAYVDEAIRRYSTEGRQATLDYYNTMESVSGELYLFVLDENYEIIVHPTVPDNIGMDIRGPLGTDITGKNFGVEFLTANEEGKWVDYVYLNPAEDFRYERKHSWLVRYENLIFGSGWYERDVDIDGGPAAYARALVHEAITRYEVDGHEATLAYYNDPASVDGQWYVFGVSADSGLAIANAPNQHILGTSTKDRVDALGKPYGLEIYEAPEEGAWVEYVWRNPESGNLEHKRSWVRRQGEVIFGAGYYESLQNLRDNPEAYTQVLVWEAIESYEVDGLDATLAHYNDSASVDGQWYVFITDEDDMLIAHAPMPSLLNTDLKDIVGSDGYELGKEIAMATEEGHWINYIWPNPMSGQEEPKRTWAIRYDGMIFGSGYYE